MEERVSPKLSTEPDSVVLPLVLALLEVVLRKEFSEVLLTSISFKEEKPGYRTSNNKNIYLLGEPVVIKAQVQTCSSMIAMMSCHCCSRSNWGTGWGNGGGSGSP